ncbi:MAG TPA: hypothetical protein VLL25_20280 [Acidimicrobiales bacterium]|nr:hypothetical protein [Acidimicrobiales bacterium]
MDLARRYDDALADLLVAWKGARGTAIAAVARWQTSWPNRVGFMMGGLSEFDRGCADVRARADRGERDLELLGAELAELAESRPRRLATAVAAVAVSDAIAQELCARASAQEVRATVRRAVADAEASALAALESITPGSSPEEAGMVGAVAVHELATVWAPADALAAWLADPTSSWRPPKQGHRPRSFEARLAALEGRALPGRVPSPSLVSTATSYADYNATLAEHFPESRPGASHPTKIGAGSVFPPRDR